MAAAVWVIDHDVTSRRLDEGRVVPSGGFQWCKMSGQISKYYYSSVVFFLAFSRSD